MGKIVEKVKLMSLFEPKKSVEADAIIDTGATIVNYNLNPSYEEQKRYIREKNQA